MSASSDFVDALRDNVDAFYADKRSYEEFTAHQRALWSAIEDAGPLTHAAVLRSLNERLES